MMKARFFKFASIKGINFGDSLISMMINEYLNFPLINKSIDLHGEYSYFDPDGFSDELKKKYRIRRLLSFCPPLIKILKFIQFKFRLKQFKKVLRENDVLIFGGGNLLYANYIHYIYQFYKAFPDNPKIIVFSGVGPLTSNKEINMLRFIVDRSCYFSVRDIGVFNYLINPIIRLVFDPAFLISYSHQIMDQTKMDKPYIAFNLMNYSSLNLHINNEDSHQLADNIYQLHLHYNKDILLVNTDLDRDLNKSLFVKDILDDKYGLSVKIVNLDKLELLDEVLPFVDFAVVSRMHAGIIFLSYGIPTLIYPWQIKIIHMLNYLFHNDMIDFLCFDINYTYKEVINKISKIRNVKIKQKVGIIHQHLLNFFDELNKLLSQL